ncbi:hypothetical protein BGZ65_004922 [Modicella reniformis]|uniref:SWIM-type domain-containing protein n=1 Tax=Modicella reniformis TaxID=1440133 RepID=A0A9P6IKU3_9FUNG|nr:hypothetical protein BGZ65_004922 [Modicella reniformis]
MYEAIPPVTRAAIEQFRHDFTHLPKVMSYLEAYYFRDGKTNWMLYEKAGNGAQPRKEKKEWSARDKQPNTFCTRHAAAIVPLSSILSAPMTLAPLRWYPSDTGTTYTIATDPAAGPFPMITECDCPDFKKNRAVCKHIALVRNSCPGRWIIKKSKPKAVLWEVLEDAVAEQREE